jgi:DNA polymerase-1
LSCTEPNLQNIPVRQELGRQFRKIFAVSDDTRIFVGADYSQIELRVLAHLSKDEALKESFAENNDIHSMTASRVFGVPLDEVTPLQRSRAKAVNFGVVYGISAFGLSEDLKISRAEAQSYIDEYFRTHPGVKQYMNDMIEFCKENNYVTTLKGRRRNISEIHASNYMTRQFGERLAMNTPVQGSAADIIKLAMISVYRTLNKKCSSAKLILQIHDELIIDASVDESEKVKQLLEECMMNAVLLDVPLVADVNTGNNWYDLK